MPKDLYREACIEGTTQWWNQMGDDVMGPMPVWEQSEQGPENPEYWIARYAARKTAEALLEEAKRLGLSDEQQEALRKVAAEVAYD